MHKTRVEAFSDGVIAIIITIMVLELKVPHEPTLAGLMERAPAFLSYVLSFIYIAIYWNNHHHMLHTVDRVNGNMLWANIHLLFWLSLIPYATAWMDESHFATLPVAVYGVVLLMAAIAYYILQTVIVQMQGKDCVLARAIGNDLKGKISPLLYLLAIGLAFVNVWLSVAIYAGVALTWIIPDRRIERNL